VEREVEVKREREMEEIKIWEVARGGRGRLRGMLRGREIGRK
jgi:hypothetical protein